MPTKTSARRLHIAATVDAVKLLRDAVTRIYSDPNPQITIRHCDARARRVLRIMRRFREELEAE